MRKRAERALRELYSITDKITEPEITPVLEGNCRIQGPVDESDHELRRTNSGDFQGEKKFAFINKSFHMKVESGTCNVCSAPCSSCMHNNRTLLSMDSKVECGSSRNSCAMKEAESCSFSCADGKPLYEGRTCDERAAMASEASNLFCASSSHDSDSENAESKATVRASVSSERLEDVGLHLFEQLREPLVHKIIQKKRSDVGDGLFSPNSHAKKNCHVTSDLCQSTYSNKDKQRASECHGDNISCITGTKDSNINVGLGDVDSDKNNTSCAPAVTQSVDNAVLVELTDCSYSSRHEEGQNNCKGHIRSPEGSFQKKHANSTDAAFSVKSDSAGEHLQNHNSSPRVQSPHSPSRNGCVACHDGDCRDSDVRSDCQPHVGGESSLGMELVVLTDDKKKVPLNSGNKKRRHNEDGFSADFLNVPDTCTETGNGLGEVISSDEVLKSISVDEELEAPSSLAEAPIMQETLLQLQQVREGGNSESEAELTDVKVCDICGDAGREELLAVCSRCSDGAEHTYCMRKMMRKIPEGDWLCEECQLNDDAERKKLQGPEKLSATAKEYKFEEDTELKKVLRSEKSSGTVKECKLKEHAEIKKGDRSEAAYRTSKECKQKDVENDEKADKYENIPITSKPTCLNETIPNFTSMSNSKVLPKLHMEAFDQDIKRVPRGMQSPKISAKRHENQEIMSSGSKRPLEVGGECIEIGSPRKKAAPSRENSFKNLDAGKAKVPKMPQSNGGQSADNPKDFLRSQSLLGSHLSKGQTQLQPPHGFFSRSSSFNNLNLKPKVKQLTESIPVKPKITRESSFNDTRKEALARSITKSVSFKSVVAGRSITESASKTQFIHQSRVEDPRSFKQAKDKSTIERKNSSVLDRLPTNSSPKAGVIPPLSKTDMKTALHDVKLNNVSQTKMHRGVKGSDDGLGRNEAKKQSIYSAKPIGSASLNAKGSTEDQKPCPSPKEGARRSSGSTDKLYNNAEIVQHRGIVQTTGSIHRDDKTKDLHIFSGSRQALSSGNGLLHCQRCNETGHTTQFCSVDKLRSSALKPLAEKDLKDGNRKANKWKDVVKATITNNRLQKKNRPNDRSEEFPLSTADSSCKGALEDLPHNSSNQTREITLMAKISDGQEGISRCSDAECIKTAQVTYVGQHSFPPADASCASSAFQTIEASCIQGSSNLNARGFFSDELNTKQFLRMLPDRASVPADPCRTSAIPELEFIWQGSLEVLTTGNEPSSFDGIQAHLSASASPRVLEVATMFPQRIQVEEFSWISSWPLQGNSPDEHNVALFFFAKDVESYERSYSKLLEKMLKNDLALRGFIDGVELLIFPSTKLPVHSQRWNRLFFLWGMFKGRGADNLASKPNLEKRSSEPILDRDPAVQDLPCALRSVISDSQTAVPVENPENRSAGCDVPLETPGSKPIAYMENQPVSSSKAKDTMCGAQDTPLVHNSSFQLAAYNRLLQGQSPCLLPLPSPSNKDQFSHVPGIHPESISLMADTSPWSEVKGDDAYEKILDLGRMHVITPSAHLSASDEEISLSSISPSCLASLDGRKGRESSGKGLWEDKTMKTQLSERNATMTDQLKGEKPNRKRARLSSTEDISLVSGETTKSISEIMLWKEKADYLPTYSTADRDGEQKKICFRDVHATSCLGDEISGARSSSKVHPLLTSFLGDQQRVLGDGDRVKAVMPDGSVRQPERFFFPVEPSPIENTQPETIVHVLSSDDEDALESPDLELALGGKWRAQKKCKQDQPAEDEVSASLSLSLAIPTPKKECLRPVMKSEQHSQERPDLNTSLLLFGSFTGT